VCAMSAMEAFLRKGDVKKTVVSRHAYIN
jgi:hypothetical protein